MNATRKFNKLKIGLFRIRRSRVKEDRRVRDRHVGILLVMSSGVQFKPQRPQVKGNWLKICNQLWEAIVPRVRLNRGYAKSSVMIPLKITALRDNIGSLTRGTKRINTSFAEEIARIS
jgi:hypothetical protein